MGRAGRPKLLQKDGHHRHDGYGRWHAIDQVHRPDLHIDLQKSKDVISNIPVVAEDSSPAYDIYSLVLNLKSLDSPHIEYILYNICAQS